MSISRYYHVNSEFLALKTVTENSKSRAASGLLSALDSEMFYSEPAKEAYKRIKHIAKKKAEIISWEDLISDPTISQSSRDKLTMFKKPPLTSREKIDRLAKRLHEYRGIRLMIKSNNNNAKNFKSNAIDLDTILQETADFVTKARSSADSSKWFTNIGAGPKDLTGIELVKKTLKIDSQAYIPTGFSSYDRRSIGIPRGTFMINATQTGGGKSVMAGQLAEQMAVNGAKVCIIPLEMDDIQMQQRQLARVADIPMDDILKAHSLSKRERRHITKKFKHFSAKIYKNGGLLSYWIPEDDISMESLLLNLKPYGYDVIIVDYIGLLQGVDGDDQWKALGRATRMAKRYATATNTVVIAFAQLNEENKIRYSKTMVEHANAAWFWKWDDTIREAGVVSVEQPKSRNQASFTFYLRHDFAKMRFINLTAREEREIQTNERQNKEANDNEKTSRKGKGSNDNERDRDDREPKQPKQAFAKVNKKLTFFES